MTSKLENYFARFRENVVGNDKYIETAYGKKKLIYADWTASGRLYKPIEKKISEALGPYVANTHTETSTTGTLMTLAYREARTLIKKHVGANADDIIIADGAGMTGVVNKFQRILNLRLSDKLAAYCNLPEEERPVVFVTHMEHHSNHTSWQETIADVVLIPPDRDGLVCRESFAELLKAYQHKKKKYAAITACSNVTGIEPCCREIAKLIHEAGGYVFVDFACNAPYVDIKMHTDDPLEAYDAIYFSPHKFLGGPGSAGILIFNKSLYENRIPDNPGGGTVTWTDAWGDRFYFDDIEMREDGGTPSFLQTIRVAFAIMLKEEMGTENIIEREEEMLGVIFEKLSNIKNIHILADKHKKRLGIISFYIDDLHYNLGVRLLNDKYGIQTRGGCVCAGTYGHYLFELTKELSDKIQKQILFGDLSSKPGMIRMSVHPVMTNEEILYICEAIKELAFSHKEWSKDYNYDKHSNEFFHKSNPDYERKKVAEWFESI